MNPNQLVQDFLNSEVLHISANSTMFNDKFETFLLECYNLIDQPMDSNNRLKIAYVQLFQELPNPKADNQNLMIFCAVYIVIKYLYFSEDEENRKKYNYRYQLNCYHKILYAVTGLLISDAFIEGNLIKIFASNYMDYTKRIVYIPPYVKPTKFFGNKIQFPKLNGEDGSEFAKNLQGIFKPYQKKQFHSLEIVEDHHHYQHNSLRKVRMNINALSPSIGAVLKTTSLQSEKPRIISHPIQKNDLGDLFVLKKLKELQDIGGKKAEPKVQRVKASNIFDDHGLPPPPKEYFQKHVSADQFFKNILSHNYVLDQRKQTMKTLPSFVGIDQKFKPLASFQSKQESNDNQEQINTKPSPFDQEIECPNDPALSKFEQNAASTKSTFLPHQSHFSKFYKTQYEPKVNKQTSSTHIKIGSQTGDFKYQNKAKFYTNKFDTLMNQMPTDFKISEIKQKLQLKMNFFKKIKVHRKH